MIHRQENCCLYCYSESDRNRSYLLFAPLEGERLKSSEKEVRSKGLRDNKNAVERVKVREGGKLMREKRQVSKQ